MSPREALDEIELRLEPASSDSEEDDRVAMSVNGVDLVSLVRVAELRSATESGEGNLAGDYGSLTQYEWAEIGKLIEGKPNKALMADGRVALLGCSCGITDCWPLYARLEITGVTVGVSDFLQPRREWEHDGLGPFLFSRARMLAAISGVGKPRGS